MGVFVRRVKIASGATAVQIVRKRGRQVLGIEHVGSAHDQDELRLLVQIAEERRHAGQQVLDLEPEWGSDLETPAGSGSGRMGAPAVVEGTSSLVLWQVLNQVYDGLGLDRVGTRRSGRWCWPG